MIPTAEHLALLRQLPEDAHAMLREHSPGWFDWNGDPDHGELLPRYPGGCTRWLPCSPTAIGQVVVALAGGNQTAQIEVDGDGGACVWLYPEIGDAPSLCQFGADAHTAMLRLLLRVSAGGEE